MGHFKDSLVQKILKTTTNVLGEDAVFKYSDGGRQNIRVIYDNKWLRVDPDTEVVVSGNTSVVGFRLSELKRAPRRDDIIVISRENREFKVRETQEDGQGGVKVLMTEKQKGVKIR